MRYVCLLATIIVMLASAAFVDGWTWDEDHTRQVEGSLIIA